MNCWRTGASIVSDIEYQLIPLEEGPHLEQARGWAKRRRVYVHHNLTCKDSVKHIGVFVGASLVSVISIEADEDDYAFLVTSPPKSDLHIVADAVYRVGWQLFNDLNAESIYTQRPTINGHEHRGSTAMCETTGLRPYGLPEEQEINGVHYSWQTYQMTRLDWLQHHQKREAA